MNIQSPTRIFNKHWNARDLLNNFARINNKFYPRLIVEMEPKTFGDLPRTENRPADYLDRNKFVQIYGRCGALMHASNRSSINIHYVHYKKQLPVWRDQLITLLNCHEVHLFGEQGCYIIHMREVGDDEVHFYRFDPVSNSSSVSSQLETRRKRG